MMLSFVKILRPVNGLMAAFAVLISAFIVGFPFNYDLILALFAVFLVSGGGMVINDYFDYEIDKINKPKRPLPSKKISRNAALVYSIVLFSLGNIIAVFLNQTLLLFTIFNSFLMIVYSWKLKKIALLGNIVVSWLAASTFLYGSFLKGVLTVNIVILFMMAFTVNVGREIVKTIEDMRGDKKVKAKTLPLVFGEQVAGWIAIFFIFLGVLVTPLPYALKLLNIKYVVLMVIADIVLAASCFALFISPKKSQKYMKIAMFIALLAFFAGSF